MHILADDFLQPDQTPTAIADGKLTSRLVMWFEMKLRNGSTEILRSFVRSTPSSNRNSTGLERLLGRKEKFLPSRSSPLSSALRKKNTGGGAAPYAMQITSLNSQAINPISPIIDVRDRRDLQA
jgi:hypothetical protein